MERDEVSVVHSFGGEFQSGLDVVAGQLRPRVDDLLGRVAVRDTSYDDAHWHTRALDARLAVNGEPVQ